MLTLKYFVYREKIKTFDMNQSQFRYLRKFCGPVTKKPSLQLLTGRQWAKALAGAERAGEQMTRSSGSR